jgi:dihydroorotase
MRLVIKGGTVVDPGRLEGVADVVVEEGRIIAVTPTAPGGTSSTQQAHPPSTRVIDAAGWVVAPGLIDLHVHLREPGEEYKETIASGARAAAAGGFTAVCAMPNTRPVNDCPEVTNYILEKSRAANGARVLPVAAISKGSLGKELTEFGELKAAGAAAVTDDGLPVTDSQLMRRALEYAKGFGMMVMSHSEEVALSANGVMNEGPVATRMGLRGVPNAAESVMVMRDIALSELTGAPIHLAHISTRESIRAIRAAKKAGLPVTAETAPHYFTLTDRAVEGYRTEAKMNPPLRSSADRDAVRSGLKDGTLDAIATDHAPHSVLEKDVEFDLAANGIIGLETALPLALRLVADGLLTLGEVIEKMALNPARILGLARGIAAGAPADLTLIDPSRRFQVDVARSRSLSRNSPFDGWELTGCAVMTIVDGAIAYEAGN